MRVQQEITSSTQNSGGDNPKNTKMQAQEMICIRGNVHASLEQDLITI